MGGARLESNNVTLPREEPPLIEPLSYLLLVDVLLIFCGISSCCIQYLRLPSIGSHIIGSRTSIWPPAPGRDRRGAHGHLPEYLDLDPDPLTFL
jgi:hypothetical protein